MVVRAVLIGNADDLDPGLVGHALRRHGYEFVEWVRERHALWPRVTQLEVAPTSDSTSGSATDSTTDSTTDPANETAEFDLADVTLVLALGSGWSTYWSDVAAAVAAEQRVMRQALAASIPVFGICFGAQQLAVVLGAEVSRAPQPEIGWHEVHAVSESAESPHEWVRAGAAACTGSWMQWHYDRFTVPQGATLLAESSIGAQAFAMGRAFAVQFHPEATESIVRLWSSGSGTDELTAAGIDPDDLHRRTRAAVADAQVRCDLLVDWFCHHFSGGDSPGG